MSEVTFILDEYATLGADMEAVKNGLQIGRKFGIRLHLYFQSRGQLAECFPLDKGTTLLSNVTQIYAAANDLESAKEISERLGDYTVMVESESTGTSYSSQSGQHPSHSKSRNSGTSYQQIGRKLLKPEEILSMDERIAIAFVPGMNPVWTRLERDHEGTIGPRRHLAVRTLLFAIWFAFMGAMAIAATSDLWSTQ